MRIEIESIKISADKHETLVMLEERKADLSKSLKEVNGAQEKEASLQFEMSQDQGKGQGVYFARSGNFSYSLQELYAQSSADSTQRYVLCMCMCVCMGVCMRHIRVSHAHVTLKSG